MDFHSYEKKNVKESMDRRINRTLHPISFSRRYESLSHYRLGMVQLAIFKVGLLQSFVKLDNRTLVITSYVDSLKRSENTSSQMFKL